MNEDQLVIVHVSTWATSGKVRLCKRKNERSVARGQECRCNSATKQEQRIMTLSIYIYICHQRSFPTPKQRSYILTRNHEQNFYVDVP